MGVLLTLVDCGTTVAVTIGTDDVTILGNVETAGIAEVTFLFFHLAKANAAPTKAVTAPTIAAVNPTI